jgi:hypothetical protein
MNGEITWGQTRSFRGVRHRLIQPQERSIRPS